MENNKGSPHKERETFGAYITIVGPVFYNDELSDQAKLLYGLLSAMCQAPRYYAFARNRTLLKYLHCSERQLQRRLKELVDAGEIEIVDGQGGAETLRKIYLRRVQPFNPDRNDGVNPDKNDGVNILYSNNKQTKRGKAPAAAEGEILEWLDNWAVKLEADRDSTVALISDLHAFVEMRKAKKKPVLTVRAASLITGRLTAYSQGQEHAIPAMRYMLQESVTHNWEKIWNIKDSSADDFADFLRREYGYAPNPELAESDYF